jgi:hypothetical protein
LERHDEQVWNMLRKISRNHTGGGCETRGVKGESGGQGNDGSQNVSGTLAGVDVGSRRL